MTEARSAARALAALEDADTIAALASPPGRGARALVRLSGPRAHALAALAFTPRESTSREFWAPLAEPASPRGARVLPGLVHLEGWPSVEGDLWLFHAPRSYTGEDVAEVHLPGSPPLVAALLRALAAHGARPAQPGEFTRRAFLRGRLDLLAAEAVLALTRAEEAGSARTAARALLGGLGSAIDRAKDRALDALAHVEAAIDFPEEDLPGLDAATRIAERVESVARDLALLERRSLGRVPSREEPTVALVGLANAGKSTLLNALAGREAAIVSEAAGTTRDAVAAPVSLAPGRTARLLDTAGEKDAAGEVEREALARGRDVAATADAVVWLVDLASPDVARARARLAALGAPGAGLVVGTKLDLVGGSPERAAVDVAVSARTGEGLDALRAAILRALDGDPGLSPDLVQTERQARLVARAREAFERAASLLRSPEPAGLELSAVDLHDGLDALGELTGALVTDDLLDKIFGEFCIGK